MALHLIADIEHIPIRQLPDARIFVELGHSSLHLVCRERCGNRDEARELVVRRRIRMPERTCLEHRARICPHVATADLSHTLIR